MAALAGTVETNLRRNDGYSRAGGKGPDVVVGQCSARQVLGAGGDRGCKRGAGQPDSLSV